MNRDKLIELANNATYSPDTVPAFQNDFWTITTAELNSFANAIIEECAKVCDSYGYDRSGCIHALHAATEIRQMKEE